MKRREFITLLGGAARRGRWRRARSSRTLPARSAASACVTSPLRKRRMTAAYFI